MTGFPAHAGMDPARIRCSRGCAGVPRTRGDGPVLPLGGVDGQVGSPHTRGWTPLQRRERRRDHGFPAHAGMDRRSADPDRARGRVPRTRGDGPVQRDGLTPLDEGSPHTRGWTLLALPPHRPAVGFPAHAGMDLLIITAYDARLRVPRTRGDGPGPAPAWSRAPPGSPHTRGWTFTRPGQHAGERGFPAHAGMDRRPWRRTSRAAWVPRTRGDGPPVTVW